MGVGCVGSKVFHPFGPSQVAKRLIPGTLDSALFERHVERHLANDLHAMSGAGQIYEVNRVRIDSKVPDLLGRCAHEGPPIAVDDDVMTSYRSGGTAGRGGWVHGGGLVNSFIKDHDHDQAAFASSSVLGVWSSSNDTPAVDVNGTSSRNNSAPIKDMRPRAVNCHKPLIDCSSALVEDVVDSRVCLNAHVTGLDANRTGICKDADGMYQRSSTKFKNHFVYLRPDLRYTMFYMDSGWWLTKRELLGKVPDNACATHPRDASTKNTGPSVGGKAYVVRRGTSVGMRKNSSL